MLKVKTWYIFTLAMGQNLENLESYLVLRLLLDSKIRNSKWGECSVHILRDPCIEITILRAKGFRYKMSQI